MQVQKWLLGKLSRVTSTGRFVPEVDGLRFVAIMSVVVFHTYGYFFSVNFDPWRTGWPLVGGLVFQGWFGVQLFFVISGFILSMPMAEQRLTGGKPVSLKKYFLRRVTRLEPPYLINLAFLFALLVLVDGDSLARLLPHYLASCAYVHNIAYFPDGSLINPAAWSLEVEVQFYIIAPLLGCVYLIRPAILRRAVLVGAILLAPLTNTIPHVHMSVVGQISYFLVGFLLSEIYVTRWKGRPAKSYLWDVLGLTAFLSLPLIIAGLKHLLPMMGDGRWSSPWAILLALLERDMLAPWAILIGYIGAFRGRLLNRAFVYPWIVVIGGMCYTIYLYHMTLLHFAKPLIGPTQKDHLNLWLAPLQEAALLLAVVCGSAVLFVVFEKPFMRKDWPQRLWQWIRIRAKMLLIRSSGPLPAGTTPPGRPAAASSVPSEK